jgi:hypothetical protein
MYIFELHKGIDFVYHLDFEIGIQILIYEIDEFHGMDGEIV